ncbi:MAG: hypothetical protein K2Y71_23980 [Xanthobacteraceae bacterium]|nr:hypothetical protein [Xanthobacteraceae bacterium]
MRFIVDETRPGRAHYAAVSEELTRAWRLTMKQPLKVVGSNTFFANAASFYSSDHPRSWAFGDPLISPWVAGDGPPREGGWAAVCLAGDQGCLAFVDRVAKAEAVVRQEYEHAATFLGRRGPPVRFIFVLVPPRS